MTHRKRLIQTSLLALALTTIPLAGCQIQDSTDNINETQASKTHEIKYLQADVKKQQQLAEQLFRLQNQATLALNQSDFKTLQQLKPKLFNTANQLTTLSNQISLFNKLLRHRYHYAVLDNGQPIDTWKLLKTDDNDSNHQRAHILINKLRNLQDQQSAINEKLWDDQNHLTDALNHNQTKVLHQWETQYFKDRLTALPIMNQIDMLNAQIAKFTQDLNKNALDLHSNRTFNDWVVYNLIVNNNQHLHASVTPPNPNDDNDTPTHPDDDDTNPTHPNNDDDNPTSTHTTTDTDNEGGHTTTTTGHTSEGGEGHAGGDAGGHAGGGGHGE